MLFFLYGADTYRIKEKIDDIVTTYRKKNPNSLSLIQLDMSEESLEAVYENLSVFSIFSEKKLLILSNVFSDATKGQEMAQCFKDKQIAKEEDVVLIIREGGEVKKQKKSEGDLVDFLFSSGKCQEFKLLNFYRIPILERGALVEP